MGCSSPNSQRSARCYLSEMDLTRQRLVTFQRGEMCAAVLQGVKRRARSGRTVECYQRSRLFGHFRHNLVCAN